MLVWHRRPNRAIRLSVMTNECKGHFNTNHSHDATTEQDHRANDELMNGALALAND